MPFQPNKIKREHVLKAAEIIDSGEYDISESTGYDVIINGKPYPPKEVGRFAHEQATGEYFWYPGGGEPTNKYFKVLGFEVVEKGDFDPWLRIIQEYKAIVSVTRNTGELYKWRLVTENIGRLDPLAPDFISKLRATKFANLIYHNGIGVLFHLLKEFPEELRVCFKNLFDESKPLLNRIDGFTAETLKMYRKLEPKLPSHQDERSIATYLTFHDPTNYTLYKSSFYEKLCRRLNINAGRKGSKYNHYLSLVNDFIKEYVVKDNELLKLKASFLTSDCYKDESNLIFAQDILYQALDNPYSLEKRYWRIGTTIDEEDFWPEMLRESGIAIGWEPIGDLNAAEINNKDDIIALLDKAGYSYKNKSSKSRKAGEILSFYGGVRVGDIVLAQEGEKVKGIALVTGDYLFNLSSPAAHTRSVRWLDPAPVNYTSSEGLNTTFVQINYDYTILEIEKRLAESADPEIDLNTNFMSKSLNTIMYGPPGTGKTYTTISKALQIINEEEERALDWSNRKAVKALFNKRVEQGRIAFSTFHQSMSYEDFIEGIKPVFVSGDTIELEGATQGVSGMGNDSERSLQYRIEPGIFKRLCNAAKVIKGKDIGVNWRSAEYYKMSLGGKRRPDIHDWCIKNKVIGLGWAGQFDLSSYSKITNWKEYRDKFKNEYPDLVKESKFNIQAAYAFQNLKVNDIVVISKGNHVIDAIGVVKGPYKWDDKNPFEYYHFRDVEWIVTDLNVSPERFFRKQISQMAIYQFDKEDVIIEAFEELTPKGETKAKPFVLIIDEINRGNISQIFGELITLIEEDKRLNNDEALEIILPYSKEKFGVPNNIYILGTMNTADKSVEALDTALRRRFVFEEKMPDPKLLTKTVSGISLQDLLTKINERVELLLDRDHTIGHSYFMEVTDESSLKSAFKNKLIPLLQEYFYGDYGKIGLVLGSGFVRENKPKNTSFAKFPYPDHEQFITSRYELIPIDENFRIAPALKTLLNELNT